MKYLLLILLLSGCSAEWHLNKAIKKGLKINKDTVYQEKIVITPPDTTTIVMPIKELRDTVIYQDRIKIKYTLKHDTLKTYVECPPDTVKIEVPVAVNTEIICPPKSPFWRNLALALMVVTALVLYFKRG